MSETRGLDPSRHPCEVHLGVTAHGTARPTTIVRHHIVPRAMGGSDEPENILRVCDNGHRSIHNHLSWLIHGQKDEPEPKVSRREKEFSRLGFDMWVKLGRPGNSHAAYAIHAPQ